MECSPENINTVLESKGYNYLKLYYDGAAHALERRGGKDEEPR